METWQCLQCGFQYESPITVEAAFHTLPCWWPASAGATDEEGRRKVIRVEFWARRLQEWSRGVMAELVNYLRSL